MAPVYGRPPELRTEAPTHPYINFFSFWLNNLYNEIKSESDLLGSSYVEVNGAYKRNLLLLIQGHVVSKL